MKTILSFAIVVLAGLLAQAQSNTIFLQNDNPGGGPTNGSSRLVGPFTVNVAGATNVLGTGNVVSVVDRGRGCTSMMVYRARLLEP